MFKELKRVLKYYRYNPIGYGLHMNHFVNWINNYTTLNVKNVFEIGANFAQDADYLAQRFGISPKDVYVFEAHPKLYNAITKLHKFNAYNYAVFNEEKEIDFNIVPLDSYNTGISSVFDRKGIVSEKVTVKTIRMDNFMDNNNIDMIDFLKLDAEGVDYEILEGFGERIKDIQTMHIEAEHFDHYYQNNKLFDDIVKLLVNNGFEMVFFKRGYVQSDSFWVKKEIIK